MRAPGICGGCTTITWQGICAYAEAATVIVTANRSPLKSSSTLLDETRTPGNARRAMVSSRVV
jgi:hypothetical protein